MQILEAPGGDSNDWVPTVYVGDLSGFLAPVSSSWLLLSFGENQLILALSLFHCLSL